MGKIEQLDPYYELWQTFAYAYRLISSSSARELRKYRLSHNTVALLGALHQMDHNPMPIELARGGKRTPQTVTAALDRMEKQGLLKRIKDRQRKNSFRISLTEKGEKAYQRAAGIKVYRKIMSVLSDEQYQQLKECLDKLIVSAGKYG